MNPLFENLFIFEMANNHQGSVQHGIDIILGEVVRDKIEKFVRTVSFKLFYFQNCNSTLRVY